MREIKYKTWDRIDKSWVKAKDLSDPTTLKVRSTEDGFRFLNKSESDFDFVQFTGLHDKNGKEIHEGDVVRIEFSSYVPNKDHVVEYNTESASFIGRMIEKKEHSGYHQDREYDFFSHTNCEVIGNIYENPELLNKQSHAAAVR